MDISIVITAYNEAQSVQKLYSHIKEVMDSLKVKYEVLFVDDGSRDNTLDILLSMKKEDKKIKIVELRRNFGKTAALKAGFKHAKGKRVITMDADLQDDPREIPRFLEKLDSGYDLVVGWKARRKDPITKTLPSKFFNYLTRVLTGVKVHDSNCGFKAMNRDVTESLNLYGELHRYIPSLALWNGFKVGEIKVNHHARKYGKSKFGTMRLLTGFLDLIMVKFMVSYMRNPFHLFGTVGIVSIILGFLYSLWTVYLRKDVFLGVVLILVGLQFVSLGLIGEMVLRGRKDVEKSEDKLIRKVH